MSQYTVVLLSSIIMYIVLAVSWTMFSAPTGYVSLATAAFFGAGIYTTAFLGEFIPLPLLMLVGGIVSFVLAFLVGAITLRLRGVYFTIFTFGLVELLKNLVLWFEIKFTHVRGRFVVSIDHTTVFWSLLVLLALLLVAVALIKRSRFGRALQAVGESEDAAAHIGVNTTLVKVTAFAVSAFAAGAAGAAMATRWSYIDPGIAFNSLMSFMPVLMAIFGGMRKTAGPVIGAILFAYLEELLITRFPSLYMIIFGAIMVGVILFLPDGIMGLVTKLTRRGAKTLEHS
ncbi:MAG: branched-chain amino acid ABC transporter permease [Oscillospiraceae bacterium]|jgi:branched-chain amino acid transport system permease protein|nr:branched-chain amino acid ABC transporter permease [Oscillospiraceae bacterium]